MTDVELIVRNELERMIPRTPTGPDWSDVVRRTRKRRMPSRPLVLAAAFVLAAILAAVGYAVVRYVIVGTPAPRAVKDRLRVIDALNKGELIPKKHRSLGVEAEKTRAGAVLQASTGPVYLWVAPTKRGGHCEFLQIVGAELPDGRPNLTGGCSSTEPRRRVEIGNSAMSVRGKLLGLVFGRAAPPARSVRIRFGSGVRRSFSVSTAGFVLGEVKPRDPIREITVLDGSGHVVSHQLRRLPPVGRRSFPRIKPTGPAHTVAVIHTVRTHRPIVLRVWPAPNGARGTTLITPGGTERGCCGRPPEQSELSISPDQIGSASSHGMLILWGSVGSRIETVELRFEGGTRIDLPIHEGFVLYQIKPANFVSGRRPIELIGRDRSGHVVTTRRLGPYAG